MRSRTAAWLLAVLAVIAAACGDGTTDSVASVDQQAETTSTEAMDDTLDDDAMDDADHRDDDAEHEHGDTVAAASDIDVSIDVTPDGATGGFVVAITTTGFTFDESAVDGDHVDGIGHAHIYVDGVKVSRIFTDSYQLEPLEPGEHQIRVELNSNDHRVYTSGGLAIQDIAIVVVEGATTTSDVTIEVSVDADGNIAGETRYEVSLGDTVTLLVTSSLVDELHLHGYDLFADLEPGARAELTFTADIPGIFEAELEGAGIELVSIEVS